MLLSPPLVRNCAGATAGDLERGFDVLSTRSAAAFCGACTCLLCRSAGRCPAPWEPLLPGWRSWKSRPGTPSWAVVSVVRRARWLRRLRCSSSSPSRRKRRGAPPRARQQRGPQAAVSLPWSPRRIVFDRGALAQAFGGERVDLPRAGFLAQRHRVDDFPWPVVDEKRPACPVWRRLPASTTVLSLRSCSLSPGERLEEGGAGGVFQFGRRGRQVFDFGQHGAPRAGRRRPASPPVSGPRRSRARLSPLLPCSAFAALFAEVEEGAVGLVAELIRAAGSGAAAGG